MNVQDKIKNIITDHTIVLFMKGTALMPMCGFSSLAVEILTRSGVEFHDIDVLKDAELRQAIKEFSDWPTIPQIYVKGTFIGGCDILKEMYQSGELQTLLQEKGITTKQITLSS